MANNNTTKQIAFTYAEESNLFLREIITSVHVSLPIQLEYPISDNDSRLVKTNALWDTGATNCVITPDLINLLGISPIGITRVTHAGGTSNVNVYMINVYLPNGVALRNVRVSECADQASRFGMIIGMDVITRGDFALTNTSGTPMMSFCMPSIHKIDFNITKQM